MIHRTRLKEATHYKYNHHFHSKWYLDLSEFPFGDICLQVASAESFAAFLTAAANFPVTTTLFSLIPNIASTHLHKDIY